MEVLEFGCGTGSTALLHAPFVKRILATDISAKMIEIAGGKAQEQGVDNVEFVQSTIEELRVDDGAWDVVLGLSILHLVEDKDAVLAKVFRALKPGGVFVASTACLADTMAWFRYVGPVGAALGIIPTVKIFSKGEILESLERAGFAIAHEWQPAKGTAVFTVARRAAG